MSQHRVFLGRIIASLTVSGLFAFPGVTPVVGGAPDYSTGFEAADGWVPGFVCGPAFAECADAVNNPDENCGPDNPNPLTGWFLLDNATSCGEPHIDTVNPFEGSQHLRFAQDPERADGNACFGFKAEHCAVSALSPVAPAPFDHQVTTISMDVAASDSWGASLRIIPQSTLGVFPGSFVVFNFYGTLITYDSTGKLFDAGVYWATKGEYRNLTIEVDGCAGVVRYFYGDELFYTAASVDPSPWPSVEQVLFLSDNFRETFDIDNFSITHGDPCPPAECGNDIRELTGGEDCDGLDDLACSGRCLDDCSCRPFVCGDDRAESGEICDGSDSPRCPGLCQTDCTCPEPVCGNDVREVGEECDGADDSACPGSCDNQCECREPGACCDWSTGVCAENVTPAECQGTVTWREGGTCADIGCRMADAWIEIVPINPYGLASAPYPDSVTIENNTITVPGGPMRVWLELRAGGWAPDELKTILCEIDASTYANSDGYSLVPPVVECADSGAQPHVMCEAVFGPGAQCQGNECTYWFVDRSREDYPIFGGIQKSFLSGPNPRFAVTLAPGQFPVADNGQPYYTGTFVLDIPTGADGIYTIGYELEGTFMAASDGHIRIGRATPAVINVFDGCCAPDGACLAVSPAMCGDIGGVLAACGGDCDGNGIPDGCDTFADCNDSGLPDSCDIANGTSADDDGNCIPDECDAEPAPLAESNGVPKSRFISFETVNAACWTAIRVELVSLNRPDPANAAGIPESNFSAFEGQYRWVGPPEIMVDSMNPTIYFTAAMLQCEPHFMDWSSVGLIHVYGTEIVPSSVYDVQLVDASCGDWNDPMCGMKPLTVTTGRWGDVVAPFHAADGGAQPDFGDIAALVSKFTNALDAPAKAGAQLQPNIPDPTRDINFSDIAAAVDAFTGGTYPFAGPEECP